MAICKCCGKEFERTRHFKMLCSEECQGANARRQKLKWYRQVSAFKNGIDPVRPNSFYISEDERRAARRADPVGFRRRLLEDRK